jgi:ABC-type sulfate/molybdate transport systems ATPase subunit
VLSRGRIAAFGDKEEVFRRPASVEVARLTGCKNFSRARMVSAGVVEALDWGCQLRVAHAPSAPAAHVGIRAHEIDFVEAGDDAMSRENVLPCWLVRSSDTPFRVTLYLSLRKPREGSGEGISFDLQAEVFKEKWRHFREHPMLWHVRLAPESLFLMPD